MYGVELADTKLTPVPRVSSGEGQMAVRETEERTQINTLLYLFNVWVGRMVLSAVMWSVL